MWCVRYIESVGSILVASVDKKTLHSRRSVSSANSLPLPPLPAEDFRHYPKSQLSAAVQELSPIIWHSVDVWLLGKKYPKGDFNEAQNHEFRETILSLIICRHKLIDENW